MNRIYFTIPGPPKAQKRHSPRQAPRKVWHLIAQAKVLFGVKLVSVMNRDPSAQDKREFNLQSRRRAPASPIIGPVLLYVVFYMPVPKGASKALKEAALEGDQYLSKARLGNVTPRFISWAAAEYSAIQWPFHTKRPDSDNLEKFVKDSLTGLFWKDDSQVQIGGAFKIYSHNPRTEVEILWP